MSFVVQRQYARDARLEISRPKPPRNLVYNYETCELSWTGPIDGPAFTHFNVRLGRDSNAPALRLPAGTTRLTIYRLERITITCWNDAVRTESAPARYDTGTTLEWVGSSTAAFGPILSWQVEYNLTADITIESPVDAAPNRRLLLYIFQDAVNEYLPTFEAADFIDPGAIVMDAGMAAVVEFAGRADGKWYPVTSPLIFDPSLGARGVGQQYFIRFADENDTVAVGTDVGNNWGYIDCLDSETVILEDVGIVARTAPTGASFITDILVSTDNGGSFSSIFPSGSANKLVLPAGDRVASNSTFAIDTFHRNDILRVDYLQVGSTISGGNLLISMNGRVV
jgi:hypothetical protein